jgi:hypothetical protein
MDLHLGGRRLQSGAAVKALGGLGVRAPANCRLIGRWRIFESDIWDRAHLNLCAPATLTVTAQGGEIAFGALEAGLEVEPPNSSTTARSKSSSLMTMRSSRPQGETRPFFKQPARRLQGLRASVWLTEYSAAIGLNDVVGNPHVLVVADDALTVRVRRRRHGPPLPRDAWR